MRVEAGPFRRRAVTLTPLIDVIFLLLLFFMLSSTFSRYGEVEIAAPGGNAGHDEAPPAFVRLTGDGLSVNGRQMDTEAAIAELRRLAADGTRNAILAVRDGPSAQQLVDAVAAIGAGTGLRLTIIR